MIEYLFAFFTLLIVGQLGLPDVIIVVLVLILSYFMTFLYYLNLKRIKIL